MRLEVDGKMVPDPLDGKAWNKPGNGALHKDAVAWSIFLCQCRR